MTAGDADSNLDGAKAALRRRMRALRRDLPAADRAAAHGAAVARLRAAIEFPAGAVISGFWSLDEEFDVRPLLRDLASQGHDIALPVVTGRRQPLTFRRWTPDMAMALDTFGVAVPPADAPVLVPAILLVPLLAFDDQGYRLGYGGGYYDRTLAALRAGPLEPLAVGIGYWAQRLDHVPHGGFDQRLDWIVTEAGARRFDRSRAQSGGGSLGV